MCNKRFEVCNNSPNVACTQLSFAQNLSSTYSLFLEPTYAYGIFINIIFLTIQKMCFCQIYSKNIDIYFWTYFCRPNWSLTVIIQLCLAKSYRKTQFMTVKCVANLKLNYKHYNNEDNTNATKKSMTTNSASMLL